MDPDGPTSGTAKRVRAEDGAAPAPAPGPSSTSRMSLDSAVAGSHPPPETAPEPVVRRVDWAHWEPAPMPAAAGTRGGRPQPQGHRADAPHHRGIVRRATLDDVEALVAANVALALETEHIDLDREDVQHGVRAVLEDPSKGMYWVIEDDGTVVAQLMITFEWSDWRNRAVWWIQSVYVLPSCRRQGRYRHLYRTVKQEAVRSGAAGLRLYADSSNLRAQDTYKSLGMRSHYLVFEDLVTKF